MQVATWQEKAIFVEFQEMKLRNDIEICRILRTKFFIEVFNFGSIYRKNYRRYEKTVCTLGGFTSMLYNMQKDSEAYLSPFVL